MPDIRQPQRGVDAWEEEGGSTAHLVPRRAAPPGRIPRPGAPRFFNDIGAMRIRIGVEALNCIGAMPPADHPHVYLDMTDRPDIACPYCATVYCYDPHLSRDETEPSGCFYDTGAGAPRTDRRVGGIP